MISDEEISDLAELLYAVCDEAVAKGVRIAPNHGASHPTWPCACPFGVLIREGVGHPWPDEAQRRLGIDIDDAASFMAGFDKEHTCSSHDVRLYALGVQMREHYARPA